MPVKVTVDTRGLQQFAKLFPARVASAINNANSSMQSLATQLAPEKSGELKESIHISKRATATDLHATTSADAEHAAPQEFGFHHYISGEFIPGQPFMIPAYEMAKSQLLSELKDAAK